MTAESVLSKIQELIDKANAKTGRSDTTLTAAVDALIAGYGTGSGESGGGEEVCSHNKVHGTFKFNGDGTHNQKTVCDICGEVLLDEDAPCSADAPTITANADGTHTTMTRCKMCNGIMSQTTADCSDEDEDGKCDVCSAQMPTAPDDDDAVWEYKQGELKSASGKKFSASDGVLSLAGNNSYVALGANGTTPQAIPIPASASKLTLTFGETGTTKVQFLFFTGSPTNVTDPVDGYSADVVNGKCIFEGKGAEYVVFNCIGSWTTIQKQQVGALATLKFE